MHIQIAIDLIRNAGLNGSNSSVWADLGCGTGLFTYALANILPYGSTIYAVDKTDVKLISHANPHKVDCIKVQADFLRDPIPLPLLDGVIMANSFHYVADKESFISKLKNLISPGGKIIIIEYDTDLPNSWVPYPMSFEALQHFFHGQGFSSVKKLHDIPSVYGRARIYAAEISR